MRQTLSLILLITCFTSTSQTIKIFGKVLDSTNGPLPGATVMLIGQQDSILKSFAVTDAQGNFIIKNVKPNTYLFKANFYGYQPHQKTLTINNTTTDTAITTIYLTPKMLDLVTVSTEYIPIRIKGDTIEYDSRAFETGEHDVVENLLELLPGVEIQADGSIKVQGKTVEKILIDGEEFFGNDPTIATKNLPANAIDKVQVFEKTSDMATFTGVDDGNKATTINLTLKEDKKKGYFGNLDAAMGISTNQNTEINLNQQGKYKTKGNINYFKGKWQLSLVGLSNNVNQTGFSLDDYISFMGGIQNLISGSGTVTLGGDQGLPLQNGQNNGFLNTNATGININYKPSKKASLTSSVFFNTFNKTYNKTIDRTTFFKDSSLFSNEQLTQNNLTYNNRATINYKQEFDSTHFFKINLSGNWTKAKHTNTNNAYYYDKQFVLRNKYVTNLNQNRFKYGANLDLNYRKKLNKKGRYTGGGIAVGTDNSSADNYLSFQNTHYQPAPIFQQTNQNQNTDRVNTNLTANWMYSEPIFKKQLLQLHLLHTRNKHTRNKNVADEFTPAVFTINELLSGNAKYNSYTNQAKIKHKFLTKKLKTTIGTAYSQLNLVSDNLFTNKTRKYNYLLPFFDINWDVNKSSDLKIDYRTRTNKPTLPQLQAIPNNTNPAEIVLGNVNLIPEYTHDISLEYNYYNEYNFTHFMAHTAFVRTLNKINYSQNIDANFNRVFTPQNNGTEDQLQGYIGFGTNWSAIKTKFNFDNSTNLSSGQLNLNNTVNKYTSLYTSSRITISNTKKKIISLSAGVDAAYSKNTYNNNSAFNSNFFSWNYFAKFRLKVKDRWIFKANTTHYFYPSFTANKEQIIINASIARNFLKSKKLQVYLTSNDILNQNTGINQSYYLNYYEQEQTATLGRYFLVGAKWSFQKLGGK